MGRIALAQTDSAPQTAPLALPLAAVPAPVPAEHAPAEAPAPDGLEAADAAVKAAREGLQAAQRATDEARANLRSSRETKLGFERDFRAANGNPTESDRLWAGLEAAMRGVERSEAELARAEQVQRDAHTALTAAVAARDALVKQRNDATKAGRLAILRAELTVGATARRDEAAVLRFARAYRELAGSLEDLWGCVNTTAQKVTEAKQLAAELKEPPLEKLRPSVDVVLAARVAWEAMPVPLQQWVSPQAVFARPAQPIKATVWEEAESRDESAAIHSLTAKARG